MNNEILAMLEYIEQERGISKEQVPSSQIMDGLSIDRAVVKPLSSNVLGISFCTVTAETRKLPPQLYMPMRVRGASVSRFLSANCETNLPLQWK